ncbi:MAG: hypothetical protein ACM3PE_07755 [Deltaproteobacteria bacterium]
MNNPLQAIIDQYHGHISEDMIPNVDKCLKQAYPGLQTRWSRVYGRRRWAHLHGGTELLCMNPLRIELGEHYGLYIDNPEVIPPVELVTIVAQLRRALA